MLEFLMKTAFNTLNEEKTFYKTVPICVAEVETE